MKSPSPLEKAVSTSVEISIRLIFLFILIAWCLFILTPFINPVLWAIIIAVSVSPVFEMINKKLGGKRALSATIIVLIFVLIIIIPSYILGASLYDSVYLIADKYQEGKLQIPPPAQKVNEWPLIGEKLYDSWMLASSNLEIFLKKYKAEVSDTVKDLVNLVTDLFMTILQFLLSVIIAGVLLATKGTRNITQKMFNKLVGDRGEEFVQLTDSTIKNVTKGILGVALIQALLLGIIYLLAGVPFAGIWALIILILGIIQLPPSLVSIPVIIYLYSVDSPGIATFWAIIIIVASLSDNVLKPILLGKGAAVPMLVIFLGAIGGFIVSGFLGLFTGAIILSLGYKLFIAWIEDNPKESSTQ